MVERPFYTRTHWETDQRCRRARYWSTEHGNRGIEANTNAFELTFGSVVHEALEEFLQEDPQDELAIETALVRLEPALQDKTEEEAHTQRCTLEGILRGFRRVIRPMLLDRYEVLHIEREVAYAHHGVTLGSKPDTLLREKASGLVVYVEWKTTRNVEQQWLQSWHTNPQLVAGAAGATATLGLEVDHAYVVGLYKGYTYKGQIRSPYAIGWRHRVGSDIRGLPLVEYATSRPPNWKGWESFKVWEEPGGVKWWIEETLPEALVAEHFVWTTPITPHRELVARWLRQSALRELEIAEARELLGSAPPESRGIVLDRYYPQNFGACQPAYGFKCPFVEACWLRHVEQDPVGSGIYRWREPHHAQEPRRWEREAVRT